METRRQSPIGPAGRDRAGEEPGRLRTSFRGPYHPVVVTVETANGTDSEESVKQLLEDLLAKYDTSRWTFTDHVVVEDSATPHSHPVLTIGTRPIVRTPFGVLTTYLHEQIHWYVADRPDATAAAVEDLKLLYPEVPDKEQGGARDRESTYLHLIVNWLELESLRLLVGEKAADVTLRQTVDGPVYGWIYQRAFEDHATLATVVSRHRLDDLIR